MHLMIMMRKSNNRRLNFISGEDFYFLAYSILLALHLLGGTARRIRDHRKISFLVQFLADDRLIGIIERTAEKGVGNPVDRELLFSSYTKAELQKREVFKILFALEKRGFVGLERTDMAEVVDVTLIRDNLPKGFLESESFAKEKSNAAKLKKLLPRLASSSFEALINRLYRERGVKAWVS